MKANRIFTFLSLLFFLSGVTLSSVVQRTPAARDDIDPDIKQLRDEFVRLTEEYKKSLRQLLGFYEKDVQRADERLHKLQELYSEGLTEKGDVEEAERALADAHRKVTDTEARVKDADQQVADALAAESELKKLPSQKPKPERTKTGRVYYVRYVIVGTLEIYEYSGAVRGHVIKRKGEIKADSRKER